MAGTIHAVAVPKWGMEMVEGTIVGWQVAVGDQVAVGAGIVEIETSKIVNTLDAHRPGTLRRLLAEVGETKPVGALIAVLTEGDVTDAEIDTFIAVHGGGAETTPAGPPSAASASTSAPAPATAPAPAPAKAVSSPAATAPAAVQPSAIAALGAGAPDDQVPASVIARRLARQLGVNLHNIAATGRNGRVSKQDLEDALRRAGVSVPPPAVTAARPKRPPADDSSVAATSLARRLAKQYGISLHDCRATGRHGRVCKEDVDAARALLAMANGQQPPSAMDLARAAAAAAPRVTELPLDSMRRTIAARLQSSKQNAPHYRVTVDVAIDQLLTVRRQINDGNPAAKVSVNDFLIKACAMALVKVPEVNIQFDGATVRRFEDADIAVAVSIDNGLITPIVRAANRIGLVEISNRMRDFSTRARIGALKADEFQGGSFSISNLGMLGVKQFDAIINPPQAAILAVGAAEPRPVVVDGKIEVATVMTLSLSSDHRVIDGAVAARFLAALKGFLQQPATMLG